MRILKFERPNGDTLVNYVFDEARVVFKNLAGDRTKKRGNFPNDEREFTIAIDESDYAILKEAGARSCVWTTSPNPTDGSVAYRARIVVDLDNVEMWKRTKSCSVLTSSFEKRDVTAENAGDMDQLNLRTVDCTAKMDSYGKLHGLYVTFSQAQDSFGDPHADKHRKQREAWLAARAQEHDEELPFGD